MPASRIIKKYPNRRLYDTEESRYITLSDIRDLVRNKVDFTVIDKKSGDDITRSILLQVISEQEQQGDAVMSRDFLSQIIRSYDKVMPGFMARYLEQSTQLFMTQQQNLRGQVKKVVGVDPVAAMTDIAQKNFNRWRSLQDEVLRRLGGRTEPHEHPSNTVDDDADTPADPPQRRNKAG